MHEMQTIVTDVRGVCLSDRPFVCHAAQGGFTMRGSFGAAYAKSLWPVVFALSHFISPCKIVHQSSEMIFLYQVTFIEFCHSICFMRKNDFIRRD